MEVKGGLPFPEEPWRYATDHTGGQSFRSRGGPQPDAGSRRGEPPASRSPRLEARAPSARCLVFRGESVSGGSRLDGALQDRPLLDDE